jgi:hypothetical protein
MFPGKAVYAQPRIFEIFLAVLKTIATDLEMDVRI